MSDSGIASRTQREDLLLSVVLKHIQMAETDSDVHVGDSTVAHINNIRLASCTVTHCTYNGMYIQQLEVEVNCTLHFE